MVIKYVWYSAPVQTCQKIILLRLYILLYLKTVK